MEALVSRGKIRSWGMCNTNPADIQTAMQSASFSTDQELYSMLDRAQDQHNLPVCASNNLGFLAYSPMAKGLLTGDIDKARTYSAGDQRIDNPRFSAEAIDALQVVLQPLRKLAQQKQIEVHQLVLAWTLQQTGVSHVLAGSRSTEQAISNAAAGSVQLNADELASIDAALGEWSGYHFEA